MDSNITVEDLYKLIIDFREEYRKDQKNIKKILNEIKNNNTNKQDREIFDKVNNDIDKDKVLKLLSNNSILSDVNLVKHIFLSGDKNRHSIKYNKYFYYWNNEWIKNDNYFFTKLFSVIKQKYLSVNIFDNFKNNISIMINNQNHISEIGKKQYLTEFKIKLKEIL